MCRCDHSGFHLKGRHTVEPWERTICIQSIKNRYEWDRWKWRLVAVGTRDSETDLNLQ